MTSQISNHVGLLTISILLAAGCAEGGSAPVMAPIDDQVVGVGEELIVNLRGTDPDGDRLRYTFDTVDELGGRATIAARPDGVGVFTWTPLAEDIGTWFVDFTVSDGSSTDTVTATIEVRSSSAQGAAPIFRQPLGSGSTLDLALRDCLELPIVVEDIDDTEVAIAQEEPTIDGAQLQIDSGLAGTWSWCPGKGQLSDDRYPLRLSADDGTNPPTLKNYLIVLRHPPRPDCPGEAPKIAHEPADFETVLDPVITADVTDDVGLKNPPLLYYSTVEPKLPVDFSMLDVVEMELESGDMAQGRWTVAVPNPVAGQGEGAQATLWYVISAGDNDDAQGDCDHVTDAPSEGAFSATVTNPGGSGGAGMCETCSADAQCGNDGDLCVVVGNESQSYCLRGCEDDDQCSDGERCTPIESIDGAVAKQCMPQSCESEPPTCEDDAFEDNDSRATAATVAPEVYEGLMSCGGDDDWYRLSVSEEATIGAALEGVGGADLDLGLFDEGGNPIDLSEGADSSEVVESCVQPGTYYFRVRGFASEDEAYDLLFDRTPGSCNLTCEDDEFEDDDSLLQANYVDVSVDFLSEDRAICSGDDDWFEIELLGGERLVVDLFFDHFGPGEDLDLHFHDADGVDLTPCSEDEPSTCSAEQGQSTDSDEHFEFQAGAACPCTYYVRVHGWNGSSNQYDIAMSLQ